MNDLYCNLSLGSKKLGLITFLLTLGMVFSIIIYFNYVEIFLSGIIIILIYSIQMRYVNYVRIENSQFIIESIFRKSICKEINLLKNVSEVIPFTHLMIISFSDSSKFLFWGWSEIELNIKIQQYIKSNKLKGLDH
jgi:hypothetical protein